jgi:uncharacterized lipoprotein YbaY
MSTMTRSCLVIAAIVLAGVATVQAKEDVLPGKVLLPDSAVLPADAHLRVNLKDLTRGVAKDAAVATDAFPTTGKRPLRFELRYNDELIEPNRVYGVEAIISDSYGKRLWETRTPIRVLTLGNQTRVELTLQPSKASKPAAQPTAFTIECGSDIRIDVQVNADGATITGLDSKVVLPRIQTPAGMKFSDGSMTLSVLGEAVYFQRTQRAYRDCHLTKQP